MENWTSKIHTKPVQRGDQLLNPVTMKPANPHLVGPQQGQRREVLADLVRKGVITPNEARKSWNGE